MERGDTLVLSGLFSLEGTPMVCLQGYTDLGCTSMQ